MLARGAPGIYVAHSAKVDYVWATTIGVVGAATVLAAWRPAVTAMRADPLMLLRDE